MISQKAYRNQILQFIISVSLIQVIRATVLQFSVTNWHLPLTHAIYVYND